VAGLELDPDGVTVYSGGADGRALAWKGDALDATSTPRVLATVAGRATMIARLADGRFAVAAVEGNSLEAVNHTWIVDPDGGAPPIVAAGTMTRVHGDRRALVVSRGPSVTLLDGATGMPVLVLDGTRIRATAGLSTDELTLTPDVEGNALIWDLRPAARTGLMLGHGATITRLAVAPDGARALTTSLDGTARIWQLDDGAPVATIALPAGVAALDGGWAPDGAHVVILGDDGIAYLHAATGARRARMFSGAGVVTAWAFAPDADKIVTAEGDGHVTEWNLDGAPLGVHITGSRVTALAVLPGGRIVTGHVAGTVRLWALWEPRLAEHAGTRSTDDAVTSLAVRGDELVVEHSTGDAEALALADLAPRGARAELAAAMLPGQPIGHVAWRADRARVAIARRNGDVEVWDAGVATRAVVVRAAAGLGEPTGVAFAPDGDHVVIAYASGGLRRLPIVAHAALRRACEQLTWFGRATPEVSAACRPSAAGSH
jgi:hypothetical protein